MRVKIEHIYIEFTREEYNMLKLQSAFVKREDFDTDKFIANIEVNYIENWAKLALPFSHFTLLKNRLSSVLTHLEYENRMKSGAWQQFSECINNIKV